MITKVANLTFTDVMQAIATAKMNSHFGEAEGRAGYKAFEWLLKNEAEFDMSIKALRFDGVPVYLDKNVRPDEMYLITTTIKERDNATAHTDTGAADNRKEPE